MNGSKSKQKTERRRGGTRGKIFENEFRKDEKKMNNSIIKMNFFLCFLFKCSFRCFAFTSCAGWLGSFLSFFFLSIFFLFLFYERIEKTTTIILNYFYLLSFLFISPWLAHQLKEFRSLFFFSFSFAPYFHSLKMCE